MNLVAEIDLLMGRYNVEIYIGAELQSTPNIYNFS